MVNYRAPQETTDPVLTELLADWHETAAEISMTQPPKYDLIADQQFLEHAIDVRTVELGRLTTRQE